jgi:hypothetical protein
MGSVRRARLAPLCVDGDGDGDDDDAPGDRFSAGAMGTCSGHQRRHYRVFVGASVSDWLEFAVW